MRTLGEGPGFAENDLSSLPRASRGCLALLGLRAAGPPGLQRGTGLLGDADGSAVCPEVRGTAEWLARSFLHWAGRHPQQEKFLQSCVRGAKPDSSEQQRSSIPPTPQSNAGSPGLHPFHTLLGPARTQLVGSDAGKNSRITIPCLGLSQREEFGEGRQETAQGGRTGPSRCRGSVRVGGQHPRGPARMGCRCRGTRRRGTELWRRQPSAGRLAGLFPTSPLIKRQPLMHVEKEGEEEKRSASPSR